MKRITMLIMGVFLTTGLAGISRAADGNWIGGTWGYWSNTANWENGIIASGADSTATFDPDGSKYIKFDTALTLGHLVFAKQDYRIEPENRYQDILTLATTDGTTPTITCATKYYDTSIWFNIDGTQGFEKLGVGILTLSRGSSFTGVLNLLEGNVEVWNYSNVLGASGVGNETIVHSGANLMIGANITNPENFVISGTGNSLRSGALLLNENTALTGSITLDGDASIRIENYYGVSSCVANLNGAIYLPDESILTLDPHDGDMILSNIISGTGGLNIDGSYKTTLSGTNEYSGGTTVSDATLSILFDDNLGSTSGGLSLTNATLEVTGGENESSITSRAITLVDSTSEINVVEAVGLYSTTGSLTGTGDLIKSGVGTLELKGANSGYTGDITVEAGTLKAGYNDSLSSSTRVTLNSGTTLDIEGDEVFGSLAGAGDVNLNEYYIHIGLDDTSSAFSGVLSGEGSLYKDGDGTMTLTGTNTYSGGTVVLAGRLIAGSGSALGTGPVTVSGGTFELVGTVTVDDNYTQQSGGTVAVELNETECDVLSVSGQATFGGTLNVTFADGYSLIVGATFDIFDWGSISGAFDTINLPELDEGLHWNTSDLYTSGTLSVMADVPLIEITDFPAEVSTATESCSISGTNNHAVVGTMGWTNAANGESGEWQVSGVEWEVSSIPLAMGNNSITVSGTNAFGNEAVDSVVVCRDPEHDGISPVHYVATNGTAVWPYTNWTVAATCIQDAVDAASDGDTVLVAAGTYASGGEPASGTLLSNRVCIVREIYLQSIDGPKNTFIVGQGPLGENAVRCVRLCSGAVLDGFTLTNGYTHTSGDQNTERGGGGVLLYLGGTVTNCIVSGNRSSGWGGGVNCHHGGAVRDSVIAGNTSEAHAGGALILNGTLADCQIHDNQALDNDGGGIYFYESGTGTNLQIYGNSCTDAGAGIYFYNGGNLYDSTVYDNGSDGGGGGMLLREGATVSRCIIRGNHAGDETTEDGGGAWIYSGGTIQNSLFVGNTAANCGGAMMFESGASNAVVENCTVVSNTAEYGGGILTWGGTLRNCIICDNTATISGSNWSLGGYSPSIEYTCTAPTNDIPGGVGCIDAEPLFIGDGDYSLSAASPCIDTGANAYAGGSNDLACSTRIIHDTVDMGAYEYDATLTDSDGDSQTDYEEYIADTNPTNSTDRFCISSVSPSAGSGQATVFFQSSENRLYTLYSSTNLVNGAWTLVTNCMGNGGADSMCCTNNAPQEFYKLEVQLPETAKY